MKGKFKNKILFVFLISVSFIIFSLVVYYPVSQYLLSYTKNYLITFQFRDVCKNLNGQQFTSENIAKLNGYILKDLEGGSRGLVPFDRAYIEHFVAEVKSPALTQEMIAEKKPMEQNIRFKSIIIFNKYTIIENGWTCNLEYEDNGTIKSSINYYWE